MIQTPTIATFPRQDAAFAAFVRATLAGLEPSERTDPAAVQPRRRPVAGPRPIRGPGRRRRPAVRRPPGRGAGPAVFDFPLPDGGRRVIEYRTAWVPDERVYLCRWRELAIIESETIPRLLGTSDEAGPTDDR